MHGSLGGTSGARTATLIGRTKSQFEFSNSTFQGIQVALRYNYKPCETRHIHVSLDNDRNLLFAGGNSSRTDPEQNTYEF